MSVRVIFDFFEKIVSRTC